MSDDKKKPPTTEEHVAALESRVATLEGAFEDLMKDFVALKDATVAVVGVIKPSGFKRADLPVIGKGSNAETNTTRPDLHGAQPDKK